MPNPATIDPHGLHYVHPSRELHDRTRVLKHGDTFAVFDEYGDAGFERPGSGGIYHAGTRFVSVSRLLLGGRRPLLLGSTIADDNVMLAVDLANAEGYDQSGQLLDADTLHLFRSKFLWNGTCHERVRVKNYGVRRVAVELVFEIEADFADIFEVRGEARTRRGRVYPPEIDHDSLAIRYDGLDQLTRRSHLSWRPEARVLAGGAALAFDLDLEPGSEVCIHVDITCETPERPLPAHAADYDGAFTAARDQMIARRSNGCQLSSSSERLNAWLSRSAVDVALMTSDTDHGPYPYAGVPWYNTSFGRDGLITALEMLWVDPQLAAGVLRYLAETQATAEVSAEDSEPGKIVHETRFGEMARLGEVPFGRYYGSIDATLLFVVLAAAYFRRTGDARTIDQIWPNVLAAIEWVDRYGDLDGDGFIEYQSHAEGLIHQGWKDSHDAVFHADGRPAPGPIALSEVQGYAYAARVGAAELAHQRGDHELATRLEQQARDLRAAFEDKFWSDELGSYVLALDGDKRPCRVLSSNAGQCLWTGVASRERAHMVTRAMLSPAMFSGWGVRTIAEGAACYNPMSYHNGSVWPHDNALIAAGMANYGEKRGALRILSAMFDVGAAVELHRMPELLCGFVRRSGQGPTLYPVACAPQAWAAGAAFLLLGACLGLSADAIDFELVFDEPVLPPNIHWVEIRNLILRNERIDLVARRTDGDVTIEVLSNRGNAGIVVRKSSTGTG